ncbi:MOSC domain-containing protein [Sulfitobacter aestuarii]|uniref:MOSC domain-containing protein n=1 Tax=Sulfitobacter aestuarii TaxID=2161676 RepID=A0ABW5TXK6_9RHOB
MPALKPSEYSARITWLGVAGDSSRDLRAERRAQIFASYAGFEGDCHAGLTRASCVRVTAQHLKGTEIRNTRQLSILSVEELAQIAAAMELAHLDPGALGASIVLEGIPDFSHVPPSSRLQAPSGASLVIDMENRPCVLPGRVIEERHPGHGPRFKSAARGRRGVTAWVEREGILQLGDRLRLHLPDQPVWAPV